MEPKRKRMSLLSTMGSSYYYKTKKQRMESSVEFPDRSNDTENLDSDSENLDRSSDSENLDSSCESENRDRSDSESIDSSDTESLDSVIENVRNLPSKPPTYVYSIKTKGLGLSAVDVNGFSNVVYSTSHSPEIHVMSWDEDTFSEKENICKRGRLDKYSTQKSECSTRKFKDIYLLQHASDVTGLSYTHGRILLMSCSVDGVVKAWNTINYRHVDSFYDDLEGLSDIHVSPRADYFATSTLARKVCNKSDLLCGASLFSFERKEPVMSFWGHTDGAECVRFHCNGMYLATASRDNTIKMWNIQSSKPVRTFQDENQWEGHIRKLAFCPNGKYLASTYFGSVKIWDIASGRMLKSLGTSNPNLFLHSICYNDFGNVIAAGGSDKEFKIWNVETESLESSSVANPDVEFLKYDTLNETICKIQYYDEYFSCVTLADDGDCDSIKTVPVANPKTEVLKCATMHSSSVVNPDVELLKSDTLDKNIYKKKYCNKFFSVTMTNDGVKSKSDK